MSYDCLHLDAKLSIARTSIAAWNALMRADPAFGRYALSEFGRSAFLSAFTVVKNGAWRVGGILHRVGTPGVPGSGEPARTYANGGAEWWEYGRPHRIGGPARVFSNGGEEWYENGELHRVDTPGQPGGPARKYSDGSEAWYERGQLHRIGGPAYTYADGTKLWFKRGKRHRVDGPAITYVNGGMGWFEHGVCIKREPGPADTW